MKKFLIVAIVGALGIVGCGGGGGSSGGSAAPAAAPTVTISAANQANVTRAVLDGGQALGQSQPFSESGGAAAQSIGSAPALPRTGVLQAVVQRGLLAAFGSRHSASIASAARPAATTSSSAACAVSGSIATTVDDADNNQSLSSGDTLTLNFNQCRDTGTDAVDGAMVFTIGSVTSGLGGNVQFSGSLAFTQLSATSGTQVANIQGDVGVTAVITSTSFQMTLTVGVNALTVASSSPGYLDTIVYEPSMQITVTATDGTLTQADVSLNGSFTASSIGGRISVVTVQPLRQLGTDSNPSSGQVVVTGASGTHLRITALNATSVQLDLDANGDAAYEGTGVFAWGSIG